MRIPVLEEDYKIKDNEIQTTDDKYVAHCYCEETVFPIGMYYSRKRDCVFWRYGADDF